MAHYVFDYFSIIYADSRYGQFLLPIPFADSCLEAIVVGEVPTEKPKLRELRIMRIDGIALASGNSSKWLLSPEQSPKLA